MTRDIVTLSPDDDMEALREIMNQRDIRHLPVVDSDRLLVGLVTHRDLLRYMVTDKLDVPLSVEEDRLHATRVRECMVTDVVTIAPGQSLREAANEMLEGKYGCLPVVEGGRLAGILTESDFVRHVAECD